jgi:hypothetical protein
MAVIAEVAHDRGGVDRLREAPGHPQRREAAQEVVRAAGRADGHADAALAERPGQLPVRRAGRRLHRVAGAEAVLATGDDEAHRALDHLVPLGGLRVNMLGGDQAARAADHVELDQLFAALPDLDAHAEIGHVQDLSGDPHVALLRGKRAVGSLPQRLDGPAGR